jgi:hypothetical protein
MQNNPRFKKAKLLLCLALAWGAGLAGCTTVQRPDAQLLYHNAKYDFTFSLPAGWRGYSVFFRQWESDEGEKTYLTHGPVIVLRHPQWKAADPFQDIPILVFTRSQWEAEIQGRFSIGAGGLDEEIAHNARYVFAISSRFAADDTVKGWKEADDIVARNRNANEPHLLMQ